MLQVTAHLIMIHFYFSLMVFSIPLENMMTHAFMFSINSRILACLYTIMSSFKCFWEMTLKLIFPYQLRNILRKGFPWKNSGLLLLTVISVDIFYQLAAENSKKLRT